MCACRSSARRRRRGGVVFASNQWCYDPDLRRSPSRVVQTAQSRGTKWKSSVFNAGTVGRRKTPRSLKITTVLVHDGSGDCLGFGKTARAHKEQWQALTNRAWVTCHSVPAAASFAFPVFVFGQQLFIVQSPTLQGRRTSFAFHSARHCFTLARAPLKRARRRHGPSSTHEATLAPVRRDSAGVRNQCKK